MSAAEPLFCFTSDRIEIHPCPNCRAPMTSISSTSSRSNSEERTFQCFNCDSADRRSFPQLGACLRYEARIAAASTEVCHLTPGIAGNDVINKKSQPGSDGWDATEASQTGEKRERPRCLQA
jgi:hypothetical protein